MQQWLMQNPDEFELAVTLSFNRDVKWNAANRLRKSAKRTNVEAPRANFADCKNTNLRRNQEILAPER